jgi:hypothetical protein
MRDPDFLLACSRAGVETTKRQASKYRRGVGAAWNKRKNNEVKG